jgi:hypothetical protein
MNNASKGRCVTVTPRGKKGRATQYPQNFDARKLSVLAVKLAYAILTRVRAVPIV